MKRQIVLFLNLILIGLASKGICQIEIERGPYLQLATKTSVIIKWSTTQASSSEVNIGLTFGSYSQTINSATISKNHEIQISNLNPATKYYYSIGLIGQILQEGKMNYFLTHPEGSNKKLRFWVTGDHGNNSTNQRSVRDQYITQSIGVDTDGWILLGDNAYYDGTDLEYQTNFFSQYQNSVMKNIVIWPSPGNHDYANNSDLQLTHQIPYYDIFTVPSKGELGGVPSGTESYYSYNIGNVHFISLDSYGKDNLGNRLYDTLGTQVVWLKNDLDLNTKMWTIVYFHHPPYTKGSHDSDAESELILIRENLNRILERYNVDLVMNGHSHSYERTLPIAGHYGLSNTMDSSFIKNTSSGNYDGSVNSCVYVRNNSIERSGTIYVVAGSSGQLGGSIGGFPHPAMQYSNRNIGGSVILEIDQNRLDLKWLTSIGTIEDQFTLMKEVNKNYEYKLRIGTEIEIEASWNGDYVWNNGEIGKILKIRHEQDTIFTVTDYKGCISDTFIIKTDIVTDIKNDNPDTKDINVFPVPAVETLTIEFDLELGGLTCKLVDSYGRIVGIKKSSGGVITFRKSEVNWNSGIYFVLAAFQGGMQIIKAVLE